MISTIAVQELRRVKYYAGFSGNAAAVISLAYFLDHYFSKPCLEVGKHLAIFDDFVISSF